MIGEAWNEFENRNESHAEFTESEEAVRGVLRYVAGKGARGDGELGFVHPLNETSGKGRAGSLLRRPRPSLHPSASALHPCRSWHRR